MWEELLAALALVLVIEGIIPFISPEKWRYYIQVVSQQPSQVIRIMGLMSMVVGAGLLFLVKAIDW